MESLNPGHVESSMYFVFTSTLLYFPTVTVAAHFTCHVIGEIFIKVPSKYQWQIAKISFADGNFYNFLSNMFFSSIC